MLKIELYDKQNHLLHSEVLRSSRIRIGRHSSCDVVIPDEFISRFAAEITINADHTGQLNMAGKIIPLSDHLKVALGEYTLVIHNLSLLDDSETKDYIAPRRQGIGQFALAFALMNLMVVGDELLLGTLDQKAIRLAEALVMFNLLLIGVTLVLSILSRAINREYRFIKIATMSFTAPIAFFIIYSNYYGLRWLLPDFAAFEISHHLVLWLWGVLVLTWLSRVVFDHVALWLRRTLIIIIAIGVGSVFIKQFFPFQKRFQYAYFEPPPILLPQFQKAAVSEIDFVNRTMDMAQDLTRKSEEITATLKEAQVPEK